MKKKPNMKLKEWRRSLGYTQDIAADQIGVPVATLRNWEQGVSPLPLTVEYLMDYIIGAR